VTGPASWVELARFEDRPLASIVATTIEAMEFDVRLRDGDVPGGEGAWIVDVDVTDQEALAEVLQEIIDEQVEFDRRIASQCGGPALGALLAITGAADVLLTLRLLDP
jgi:hypothetical protein